jgi:hypothetical protein
VSSVFQGLLDANGRISVGTGPTVSYFRGLPLNAAREVIVGAGPITRFNEGIPFNAAGEVVGIQATQPSDFGPGATPYGPNGELAAAPAAAINNFHQGVPYNANGVYCGSGAGTAPTIISKNFTLTPAQVSSTTVGYRAAPASGTLAPDNVYGGGTIATLLVGNDDVLQVGPTGGAIFPSTAGNLSVAIGVYQGPTRIILVWDGISLYTGNEPGLYVYLQGLIGTPTAVRISAAPAGTA